MHLWVRIADNVWFRFFYRMAHSREREEQKSHVPIVGFCPIVFSWAQKKMYGIKYAAGNTYPLSFSFSWTIFILDRFNSSQIRKKCSPFKCVDCRWSMAYNDYEFAYVFNLIRAMGAAVRPFEFFGELIVAPVNQEDLLYNRIQPYSMYVLLKFRMDWFLAYIHLPSLHCWMMMMCVVRLHCVCSLVAVEL